MDASFITEIIKELPEILKYIYPGYISLWIHNALIARNLKESDHLLIKVIVISYIYVQIICGISVIKDNEIIQNVLLIILSLSIPYIGYLLKESSILSFIENFLKIDTSPATDIIDKIKQPDGTWVRAYMDDIGVMYEGSLRHDRMNPDEEKCIALSGFISYKISSDDRKLESIIEDNTNDNSKWVALKYDLISRIEIVYDKPV